jgi:hypothetical protein
MQKIYFFLVVDFQRPAFKNTSNPLRRITLAKLTHHGPYSRQMPLGAYCCTLGRPLLNTVKETFTDAVFSV